MINSPRINKICELVDKRIIAEIGCDHAYITKNLFQFNKIDFAILSDISEKCLQKAVKNLEDYKIKTTFFVGDGLQAINLNTYDIQPEQIIIAGMGGHEIINILKNEQSKKYSRYVLQPQKNVVELRTYLHQNNFEILKDEIVQEGKIFYYVLKVEKVDKPKPLSIQELYFGNPSDLKTLKEYLKYELSKRKEISAKKKVLENETLIRLIEQHLLDF